MNFITLSTPSSYSLIYSVVKLPKPLETLGAPPPSPETLYVGNNSEVSVNKKAGNLAKCKEKWSLITKNYFVLEIASQCKTDFINDSPPVQTCPQCELRFSELRVQCH